jgi:hypothetical protein
MSNYQKDAWNSLLNKTSRIVEDVPLNAIKVDMRFQRPLYPNATAKIKKGFHPAGLGILLLATIVEDNEHYVDSDEKQYVVIDGQTRWEALMQLHDDINSGDLTLPFDLPATIRAEVYEDLTPAEAGALFNWRNAQKAVPPKDKARIAVTGGDPTMLDVLDQVKRAGYEMFTVDEQGNQLPGDVPVAMAQHHALAVRIYKLGNRESRDTTVRPELLFETLTVNAQAFGTELGSVDKTIVAAIADLLRMNDNIIEDGLANTLATLGITSILGNADRRASMEGGYTKKAARYVIATAYNHTHKASEDKIRH